MQRRDGACTRPTVSPVGALSPQRGSAKTQGRLIKAFAKALVLNAKRQVQENRKPTASRIDHPPTSHELPDLSSAEIPHCAAAERLTTLFILKSLLKYGRECMVSRFESPRDECVARGLRLFPTQRTADAEGIRTPARLTDTTERPLQGL